MLLFCLILVIAIVMVRSGFALEIMTFAKWIGVAEKMLCRVDWSDRKIVLQGVAKKLNE